MDRIVAGGSIDLDTLALDFPGGAERINRLLPVMTMMSELRARSGGDADNGRPVASVEPGRDLGDFRTIRVIGRGGMGVVYEAVQISLNRRVALKILPATSADDPHS